MKLTEATAEMLDALPIGATFIYADMDHYRIVKQEDGRWSSGHAEQIDTAEELVRDVAGFPMKIVERWALAELK